MNHFPPTLVHAGCRNGGEPRRPRVGPPAPAPCLRATAPRPAFAALPVPSRLHRALPAQARRLAGAVTLLASALLAAGAAAAAPFTPASDDTVVERLPARWDAATRRQHAAWQNDRAQLPLALATARAAIDRSRRHGDPRELGLAQAALAPWWSADAPPPAVRLLRATIRQSQHDFGAALQDLDALAVDGSLPPALQAQAALTRATVWQVTGRLDEADAACRALQGPRFAALGAALSLPARACTAELHSLRDPSPAAAAQADRALQALAREAPGDGWIALLRAELAQRGGDPVAAQARFAEALAAGDPGVYAIAAHADALLDAGRAAEALRQIDAHPAQADADALLLRRAIALHRLKDPGAADVAARVQARFDAAARRGERGHEREQAMLALAVRGDAAAAWSLAQRNWAQQKEPADVLLLARTAAAAGQAPAAAALLKAWRPQGWRDARLPEAVTVALR